MIHVIIIHLHPQSAVKRSEMSSAPVHPNVRKVFWIPHVLLWIWNAKNARNLCKQIPAILTILFHPNSTNKSNKWQDDPHQSPYKVRKVTQGGSPHRFRSLSMKSCLLLLDHYTTTPLLLYLLDLLYHRGLWNMYSENSLHVNVLRKAFTSIRSCRVCLHFSHWHCLRLTWQSPCSAISKSPFVSSRFSWEDSIHDG